MGSWLMEYFPAEPRAPRFLSDLAELQRVLLTNCAGSRKDHDANLPEVLYSTAHGRLLEKGLPLTLAASDWAAIVGYLLITLFLGLYFRGRSGKSTEDYFVSGRNVSWWLAGTSMVATTFAADTPLVVTGLVYANGVAGNWLWWSFLPSGMMTVFLFARLWRRSGLITDVQFAEMRYSGKPAAFLRGFRAVYLGLLMNCLILGWVTKAMVNIISTSMGISDFKALLICVFFLMPFTGVYVSLGGLWGVLWTDLSRGFSSEALWTLPVITFVVHLAVQWWAFWYPGSEPGGGGYIAQRIFSAKDERNGLLSVLWFNLAHYALRPWPWILTALAAIVLYPHLEHPETGYMLIVTHYVPPALRGIVVAGFMAAFMSTIATQLNWGASYLVADFYRRFLKKEGSDAHYVLMSRVSTVLLVIASALVSVLLADIRSGWQAVLEVGAGTGGVYLLRWYWWRINAWSEISAMATALFMTIVLRGVAPFSGSNAVVFAKTALTTSAVTTLVWLIVTYATKPEPEQVLLKFYRDVRPHVSGWQPVARLAPEVPPTRDLGRNLLSWMLGCFMVYMALFGLGHVLLGPFWEGIALLTASAICAGALYSNIARSDWSEEAPVAGD